MKTEYTESDLITIDELMEDLFKSYTYYIRYGPTHVLISNEKDYLLTNGSCEVKKYLESIGIISITVKPLIMRSYNVALFDIYSTNDKFNGFPENIMRLDKFLSSILNDKLKIK